MGKATQRGNIPLLTKPYWNTPIHPALRIQCHRFRAKIVHSVPRQCWLNFSLKYSQSTDIIPWVVSPVCPLIASFSHSPDSQLHPMKSCHREDGPTGQ